MGELRALTWGEALRLRAAFRGFKTQKELADAMGVSRSAIQSWLTAKTCPPFRMGNDQTLMAILGLETLDELQRLPEFVEPVRARRERVQTALREADFSDIPWSVIMGVLIDRGIPKKILIQILEAIPNEDDLLDKPLNNIDEIPTPRKTRAS